MPRKDKIQLRRGTAAEWSSANPILADGEEGHETNTGKRKIGNGTQAWNDLSYLFESGGGGAVDSVNGQTGVVTLTKSDIGLNNVDNTSDLNKPISTATQTALNAKQETLVSATNIKTINGNSVLGSGDLVVGGALARNVVPQTISNTAVETAILSYTIPANLMGTDKILEISISGYFLNNSGTTASATFRLKVKLGAAAMYSDITAVQTNSTNFAPVYMDLKVIESNSTSAQRLGGLVATGLTGAATVGSGDLGTDECLALTPIRGTGTQDMTVNQDLEVSIELGKADANLVFVRDYWTIKLV